MSSDYFNLKYENEELIFINQTILPFQEEYINTDDYNTIAEAIERLEIRGAPAIGVAGAYALALSQKEAIDSGVFQKAYNRLAGTRPTAVNLIWALNKIRDCFNDQPSFKSLIEMAIHLHEDDENRCLRIGQHGIEIFQKPSRVITHCNTGKLATAGEGTAFNVIKQGYLRGLVEFVYADETRPLLQGSRLTAFELAKNNIPFSIISDSMSSFFMKKGEIDVAITGADRIAANGDSANKIGTYTLAIACKYHHIPFYIAAPKSTIDKHIENGSRIPIEMRKGAEVLFAHKNPVTLASYPALSPSFDVTPAELIHGIITEDGIYRYPYNFRDI
jgi:methylthioribose-1-phosphate isomerase